MDRHTVFLLLPWYLNDTLHGREAAIVNMHVKNCGVCQREIDFLLRVKRAVQDIPERLPHYWRLRGESHTTGPICIRARRFNRNCR